MESPRSYLPSRTTTLGITALAGLVGVGFLAGIALELSSGHTSTTGGDTMLWTELYSTTVPLAFAVLVLCTSGYYAVATSAPELVSAEKQAILRRSVVAAIGIVMWPQMAEVLLAIMNYAGGGPAIVLTTVLMLSRFAVMLGFALVPLFIALWVVDEGPLEPLSRLAQLNLRVTMLLFATIVVLSTTVSTLVTG